MSANSSSECSQTQPPEKPCQTAADVDAAETSTSVPSTTEGSDAALIESTSKQDPSLKPADNAGVSSHDPAPSIGNDKALSITPVISSQRPAPSSTPTGVGGPVVQTSVSSTQVSTTASTASPHVSVHKAQTAPTQPTTAKTVAPTPPCTPAPKSSVAMVRPPQTASVHLPATFQIPPGMVLVRSDSGQLMLVSQQALAQAQRAINNPGLVQPSAATVIRKPGSAPIIRVCPPVSTPKPTYAIGTIQQRPSSATGPTLQRPSAVGRVPYRPTTPLGTIVHRPSSAVGTIVHKPSSAVGTIVHRSSSAVGTIVQRPSSAVGTIPQRPSSAVGTIPLRHSSAVGNIPQRLSSAVGVTCQHITCTTGTTIMKASGGASAGPAVIQTSHLGGLAPRILSANVPNKPKASPSDTVSSQTMENVKKCKNFLVTLMKLASSGSHSSDMGMNVRNLVKSLLDGKLEAEEFTEKLYAELKSSPQPYLVTFLKRSLPAVRQLTPNSQLFIQQCEQPSGPAQASASSTSSTPLPTQGARPAQLVIQPQHTMVIKKPVMSQPAAQGANMTKHFVLQTGRTSSTGPSAQIMKSHPASCLPTLSLSFKENTGTFRDEDDINDVASMAGVSVSEERARILATGSESVGRVIRSCRDEPFFCPTAMRTRITHTALSVGVSGMEGDVVGLMSHATEERLRDLLGKLTVTAQHRHMQLKDCWQYQQVTNVRSQLRFLEHVERLQQQRRDEEEREMLLRIAKSRSSREDPEQQCLKQKAKEMQQLELAQAQHRQANLAALAAIGPRRKRPLEVSSTLGQRSTPRPVTRVTLRDLIFCMEQDSHLSRSILLYSAMMK